MKKLALALLTSLTFVAPAAACPGMDGHKDDSSTPKTAEKAKETPKATEAPKAKAPEKKDDSTKTAKPTEAHIAAMAIFLGGISFLLLASSAIAIRIAAMADQIRSQRGENAPSSRCMWAISRLHSSSGFVIKIFAAVNNNSKRSQHGY
jgi:hypothetical protein